jgi:hypothetical protein
MKMHFAFFAVFFTARYAKSAKRTQIRVLLDSPVYARMGEKPPRTGKNTGKTMTGAADRTEITL